MKKIKQLDLFGQKKNKGTILFLSMFITRTFEIPFNQLRLAGSHSIMQNPIKQIFAPN
jgi:hypothetical protein